MKKLISLLVVAFIVFSPATAQAQFNDSFDIDVLFGKPQDKPKPLSNILVPNKPEEKLQVPEKKEPVVYEVIEGDNLSKIGTKFNVEWQRLWAKNLEIKHPDVINIGDKLTIPEPSEELSREIPVAVSLPVETPGVSNIQIPSSAGNTYDYGYCTWYVKSKRGSTLPNGLGNANTWYYRAQGMGMAVGSTPKAGAVGTTTRGSLGHVVYVESVNADGSVNISEMNYQGWGVVSRRTAQANEFVYIY